MAKQTPHVSFRLSRTQFLALIQTLRLKLNEFLPDIGADDSHEQMLFDHNYWLIKTWIAQTDRPQEQFTVKVDIMYAKAFMEYWGPVDLPDYELLLLRKVIANLDRGIEGIEHKRRTRQL